MRGDGIYRRPGSPYWYMKYKQSGRYREISTKKRIYREALREKKNIVRALDDGKLPDFDMSRWPFERAAQEFLTLRKGLVAPNTWRTEQFLMKPLLASFGGLRLADISGHHIACYKSLRKQQGRAPRTINLERAILRMILRRAKLWSRLADDDDAKPFPKSGRGPGRALSPEEEVRLFALAASNPNWLSAYCAGLLSVNTTMRSCELKSLRWKDVDLFERTLTVLRMGTKSDAGARRLPLNLDALSALAKLRERAEALGIVSPDHYVFPACEHGHIDPTRPQKTWRTAWRSLTKKAGLKGLRFHDCRHLAVTKLAEGRASEQTILAIAGHVSREMLEHYSHIRMKAKREALDALSTGHTTEPEPRLDRKAVQ